MQGVWWKPFKRIALSAGSNRSSLEFYDFFLWWLKYGLTCSTDKSRMLELPLSKLKANNSVVDYKKLHTENMNIFCEYCSFSCQSLFSLPSFALLSNEIGILLSQALLTTDRMKLFPWLDSSPLRYAQRISFFAHLYCSFQLGRQYKQQEAAGERIGCTFSPDRKIHADKKVRIRQLRKFLCFIVLLFMWENSHTCAQLTPFLEAVQTTVLRTWIIRKAGNTFVILCSNISMEKSSFLPKIFSLANVTQPLLHHLHAQSSMKTEAGLC